MIANSVTTDQHEAPSKVPSTRLAVKLWGAIRLLCLITLIAIHLFLIYSVVYGLPAGLASRLPHGSFIWVLHHDGRYRSGPPGADFSTFYQAGKAIQQGKKTIYWVGGYRYLPGFAILCSKTFATLPPGQAYIIWIGIMEGLALLAALLVWMRTPEGWNRVAAIALLLLNTPYMLEVHMGQFTFATFVLTSAAVVLLDRKPAGARGRWWTRAAGWLRTALAALIFATASWVKIYPLVSSPTLIRRRGGWLCLGLAAAAIWLTSVSFYQTHPGTFEQFMKINLSAGFGGMDAGNHGLAHVIFLAGKQLNGRWEPDLWARVVKYWTLAVLIPTALAVLFSREKSVALGTLALLTAHVLCYKHVWEHHYSGLIAAALIVFWPWLAVRETERCGKLYRSWRMWCAAACLLLLALPTPFAFVEPQETPKVWDHAELWAWPLRYLMPLCKAVPTFILFGMILEPLFRSGFALPYPKEKPLSLPAADGEGQPLLNPTQ